MKLFILIITVLMSITALAHNPQIRTCLVNNSYFWAVDIEHPSKDNIGFCRYDDSLIGAITLMKLLYDKVNTEALDAFYSTMNSKVKNCDAAGAQTISSIDSDGTKRNLCYFNSDYSFILEKTLTEGWNSEFNAKLVDILK